VIISRRGKVNFVQSREGAKKSLISVECGIVGFAGGGQVRNLSLQKMMRAGQT
jgi:hypothetical protein